jgi:ATP-binding cassette, subfamily B, multidrug efflux pump
VKTVKQLVAYALKFKKGLTLGIFFIVLSTIAELTGPFLIKTMIDEHVLGVEGPWYETETDEQAVFYDGSWYTKEINTPSSKEISIVQVNNQFYFVPQAIVWEGKRSYKNGELVVINGKNKFEYPASPLSLNELILFYKPEVPSIMFYLLTYLVLMVISAAFVYGQRYQLQKTAHQIIRKMRNDVFQHIQTLPIRYFDTTPAGKIVARITNDTESIRELFVTVLATFVTSFIYIAGIYVAMFLIDAKLAAVCLLLLPVLYVWMIVYRKFASTYNKVIRSKNSEINAKINESIQGMKIIQAFGRERWIQHEFEKLNETHFRYQNKLLNLNALASHNFMTIVRNVTFVAFIWYFGHGVIDGNIVTLGVLYAFVDYINRLFQPLTGIVNQFANMEKAFVSAERVFDMLEEKGTSVSDKRIPRYKGNVTFEHVSFGYKEGETVLKDISFKVKHGETVALVGHTGSGKSSIINLLFRFYDYQKGRIFIDGMDIKEIPVQALREHMGIVLQDPFLFTGTIASNVTLNHPNISREKMEQALRDVGAESILAHLENGWDTVVNEKGSTLSAGQRQLISFARALAFDPSILILDEATSNIDTETEAIIQQAMDVLKKGRTTFIIAHRLSTIKKADQILVLDKGQIVERGTHDELMKLKGKYYQMYQMQHATFESVS